MDLVHAGILHQVPGRRVCLLTVEGLRAWIAGVNLGEASM